MEMITIAFELYKCWEIGNVDYTKPITLLTTNKRNETQLRRAFFILYVSPLDIELIERKLLKHLVGKKKRENYW